ncbi:collagen-like protein [Pedobacter sp. Leaf250]|uniref:collagen-like protein n=1 Tax=Pedobacter sp. Leaf250 TaxID=2876559 RepID=UPI001E2F5A81|nr:collagen-like protein [Pedobacter sp. Leaf250]
MKNFTYLLAITLTLFIGNVWAQSGLTGINYQAVARNNDGTVLARQNVKVRISILGGSATGNVQYLENHDLTTNNLGLFTLQIGRGTLSTGTLAGVPWQNANQYLKVELAIGGGSFTDLGATQLMSVPFALYAASGNPGPIGLTGPIGPTGAQGPMGPQGLTGASGPIGLTGPAGPVGATGPQGATGVSGAVGPAGPIGATGTQGPIGPVGPAGASGSQGPVGATGPAGPIGLAGPAGTLTGAAGGDLGGNYPNPNVKGIQNVAVDAIVPLNGQVLKFNGTRWAPAADAAGGFTLPYLTVENSPSTLLSIANNGDGTSIEAVNNTTTSSVTPLRGIINSTSPGGFSAGVRGINNGTGGLGIGVWGSQAGSGWGVYGVTPTGIGVYGNSTGAGYGVFGNSSSGTGIYSTSNTGTPAEFLITNSANANSVLSASTNGDGAAVEGTTSSTTSSIAAVKGTISSTTPGGFSSAVRGINNGTGGLGIGVWGSQAGSGWGVYGVTPTGLGVYGNSSGAGTGVFANSSSGTGLYATSNTGIAANIIINNNANSNAALTTSTLGTGRGIEVSLPNSSSGSDGVNVDITGTGRGVFATSAGGTALEGITQTISGAGVIGRNATGEAVVGISSGASGVGAVVGRNDGTGYGVRGFNTKAGIGVLGQAGISGGTGIAGRFENVSAANNSNTLEVNTNGVGNGININLSNSSNSSRGISVSQAGVGPGVFSTSTGGNAVWGITSSISAAGVIGDNASGEAIVGRSQGGSGIGAVVGRNDNAGYGVRGFNTQAGIGVLGQAGISGGTGRAARFENVNSANNSNTLEVSTNGNGNLAVFIKGGNVARIDVTGRGFFNGGTQASGADVAEAFDVSGDVKDFEPGDILIISVDRDRAVEKSNAAYSSLVAGVYATKPGVLLTEEHIDSELLDKVPMGVIGVIPTKVCLEGGSIKRGDMLVTSSKNGVAMKADLNKVKVGQVLGKALQDYDQNMIGKIKVLVSIK